MHESDPYLLQCIRLGMLLQDPNELDKVEPWHFGDPALRDIVSALKNRKESFNGSNRANADDMGQLPQFLESLGCDHRIQSVRDARHAICDRVEVDGGFVRAVEKLSVITEMTVNGNIPSEAKRKFSEQVTGG